MALTPEALSARRKLSLKNLKRLPSAHVSTAQKVPFVTAHISAWLHSPSLMNSNIASISNAATKITIAHSPDSDDQFLFWALKRGEVDSGRFTFEFTALETQMLNEAALKCQFDVVAISAAAYPTVQNNYLVLPHGASVGRNFGPTLVTAQFPGMEATLDSLKFARIGVPGQTTTARMLVERLLPEATLVNYSIEPYDEVFTLLSTRNIDAAVLIHEGQLCWAKRSLNLVADLGKVWFKQTSLPLPLGLNVIRRGLGAPDIRAISTIIKNSICWGLDNKPLLVSSIEQINNNRATDIGSTQELLAYLDMYANEDSRSMSDDCKLALQTLVGNSVAVEYAYEDQ